MMKKQLLIIVLLLSYGLSFGQEITREKFNDSLQGLPSFSSYQDNYFVTGLPTNRDIDRNSADAKYQVSFKQIISRDLLPFESYLYLTYTQKAFWNIYKESLPFRDVNFNPSIAIGKAIFNKDNQLRGIASLEFEHESNGRDSISSRSWNRITAGYTTPLFKNTTARFELWLPFGYQESNADLLDYVGVGEVHINHEIKHDKLTLNLMLRKGLGFDGRGVVRSRLYYNPFKTSKLNQYIMLEWYLGQAESLLDFQKSSSIIRLGYVIKSTEFNWFRNRK
ncbi:phospholipase [Dokdonia sp. Dokd-P16]|uniref:phospholipase A n=1 Tax=Dokdonia sp. Dokd-P16 TaxID=2173169 RepID=UPI000D547C1D|nr:phospholipase A [Dokdonia sp. Dokd-P16]AWH75204.1 phospholipase [Dokdonia sp. Dokd-P16]